MAKVMSAAQKDEAGLLGAIPQPKPDGCPRCEEERAARQALEAELEAALAEEAAAMAPEADADPEEGEED